MGIGRAENLDKALPIALAANSLCAALVKSEMGRYNAASFP